jgi:serine/threonine protein kinase
MAKFQRGDRFGNHEIWGLLAATEAAEIYDVIAPGGRRRALKVLKEDPGLTSKLRARLAQEGEIIATIEHVNVVRFFDAGEDAGQGWILMERVHGGRDLRSTRSARRCARHPSG